MMQTEMGSLFTVGLHLHRISSQVSHKTAVFYRQRHRAPLTSPAMVAGPSANNFLERTRDAKKIIVVDFGFLGDSVHLVPALWEIKRHYPAADLHTLSAVVGAELLKLAPCVDRPWAFPLTPESPPWWRHWGVLRDLR